ncbi:MAG: histidine phosphatase family protein [Deltaproteobacteria bacterium]
MAIYLVRHAPTEANRSGFVLGTQDSPLAEGGADLLRLMIAALSASGIERIYSSPLGRALATARIISEEIAVPLVILPGLTELSAGNLEGRRRSEVLPQGGALRGGSYDRPGGGESYSDAVPRVTAALKAIYGQNADGSLLVVAHSVVNRILLALFLNRPIEEFIPFTQPHEVILSLGTDGAVFCRDIVKWGAKRMSLSRI